MKAGVKEGDRIIKVSGPARPGCCPAWGRALPGGWARRAATPVAGSTLQAFLDLQVAELLE